MTLDEYFDGNEESRYLFDCLRERIQTMGSVDMLVHQSQIAFRRNKAFAYLSLPHKHGQGRGSVLILYLSLRRRDSSPRWKKVVSLPSNTCTHYMELFSSDEVDDQVCSWLQEAWGQAA